MARRPTCVEHLQRRRLRHVFGIAALQGLMGSHDEGPASRDVPACHDGRETVWPESWWPTGGCLALIPHAAGTIHVWPDTRSAAMRADCRTHQVHLIARSSGWLAAERP